LGQLGTVALDGTNNGTGLTTINKGVLLDNGVINGAVTVAGGTFTVGGIMNGPVSVNAGTLTGTGTITAPVVVNAGGIFAPGSPLGTMTISNTLTLQPGSSTVINVNASTGTGAQITGLGGIVFGGTLVVSNQSGVLAAGESFNVFNAGSYSGAFNRISPATPGPGLVWDTGDLAASGALRVISTSNALITAQMAAAQLCLSWPSNNIGWVLQTQTNPPGAGITSNWVTVPGSFATNFIFTAINPNVGSVFYRLATPSFSTAIFAPGDLIVLQVGNGSIASSGAPGVLNDYSPFGGAAMVQVSLPATGGNALIFGASSYDGVLSLSANGYAIVVEGYHVSLGAISSDIDTSSTSGSSAVPRGVGLVAADGTFALGATTAQFSGGTIRSAVADGSGNFWAGGGSSGIVYLGSNSPAATVSTITSATRDFAFVNGNIYFTETGSGVGVMGFSGAPAVAATPALKINTFGTGSGTPSPKGFAVNSSLTIAYVADNRLASAGGGVQRFNWNGSAWVYAYTLGNTLTSSTEVDDLAVDFSGANPVIYAVTGESTGNHLLKVTDTGAGSVYSSLETAPGGDAFRGVVLAPGSP